MAFTPQVDWLRTAVLTAQKLLAGVQLSKTAGANNFLAGDGTYKPAGSGSAVWGGITGTLSDQTDLATALAGKYSTTNPAGYIDSSALAPYLTSATAAATYLAIADAASTYLTISNAAATYLTQSNASSTYLTQANAASTYLTQSNAASTYATQSAVTSALALKADLAGATFSGAISASNLSGTNTGDQTSVTGNAGTATALATARNINGVAFDGTANITVAAAAGTLTGATLASGVTASSLTSVGTLSSLAVGGTSVFTSASAAAFAVGANGATNPAFLIIANIASSATGVSITSRASGAGVTLAAISSGTNENITITGQGTGSIKLDISGSNIATFGITQILMQPIIRSSTGNAQFVMNAIASTSLTAGSEVFGLDLNLSATQTHSNATLALQRDVLIRGSNHAFTSGSQSLTTHAAFAVELSTGSGANGTITSTSNIYVAGVALTGTKTNSYGLNITANSGATNNYAARLAGSAGEIFRVRTDGQIALLATNTAAGTTGNQTINKPSGTVNIAATGTSITVTNSLCTTSSIVLTSVLTNDTTALIKNVVPGSGSFVITMNAAVTAETAIGFFIMN